MYNGDSKTKEKGVAATNLLIWTQEDDLPFLK
jgi:hypothetical protein